MSLVEFKGVSGIYRIRNLINGDSYIGSSVDMRRRWWHHKRDLNSGISGCRKLQRAWDKYGPSAFVFEPLIACHRDRLKMWEQLYLDHYGINDRAKYNCFASAEFGANIRGKKQTAEHKEKRLSKIRGRKHTAAESAAVRMPKSEACKQKLSAARKGKSLSPEHKAKIAAGLAVAGRGKGCTVPQDVRDKISTSHKARYSDFRSKGVRWPNGVNLTLVRWGKEC